MPLFSSAALEVLMDQPGLSRQTNCSAWLSGLQG